MASNTTKLVAGGALVALLLLSGKAKADEPGPKPGPDPDPGPKPEPESDDDEIIILDDEPEQEPDVGSNWGLTPPDLRVIFATAEYASGIAGLARYLAVKSWQASRAGQAILGPAEAAAWAASHPDLCMKCQNESASEIKASFRSLERNTLPKGQVGPNGGVGSHKAADVWQKPTYYDEWGNIGSAGLFDMLGGTFVYSGIHNGFTPFLSQHADVMFDPLAQCFAAGYFAYRCFNGSLPLFSRANGDPVKLWTGLAQCWASPQSFLDKETGATERFKERAKEIGIDLSKLAYPKYMSQVWPGAKVFYTKLGVDL
jgi:hypothetical protein